MPDGRVNRLIFHAARPVVVRRDAEVVSCDPDKTKALIAEIGPAARVDLPLSVQPVQLYQHIGQLAHERNDVPASR